MKKARFVLVHGGCHTGACWSPLVQRLQGSALAINLPGRSGQSTTDMAGLDREAYVASALAQIEEAQLDRFVLVGHSLAGLTMPDIVANLKDRVTHIVFLSCILPREGYSVFDTIPRFLLAPYRAKARRGEPLRMPSSLARLVLCNGMEDRQIKFTLGQLCDEPPRILTEKVSFREFPPRTPITYVMHARDRALPPILQRAQIRNLNRQVTVLGLDTCHDSFIAQPRNVAALLMGIAATQPQV